MMYCPRCRTRYKDPPDVCRYCEVPLVEELQTRTLRDYMESASSRDDEETVFSFPDEQNEGPRNLADIAQEVEDQKTRVRLLSRYLVLRIAWFAAWLAAGFLTAHFITPDDAGQEMRLLIHTAFIVGALVLANLILRMGVRQYPSDSNDSRT